MTGRIRVVCTGQDDHDPVFLDNLAVTDDGQWHSTVGQRRPVQPSARKAPRRRLILGDRELSDDATPGSTFDVQCRDPACRRNFRRHREEFGRELAAMVAAGQAVLDISRLPI